MPLIKRSFFACAAHIAKTDECGPDERGGRPRSANLESDRPAPAVAHRDVFALDTKNISHFHQVRTDRGKSTKQH